jgi:hypothetical protein
MDLKLKKQKANINLSERLLFSAYIMARTIYIRWDYNDVGFVLDQHA